MTDRPVLVAPDSFKGTFRAAEVAAAIGRGLESAGLRPPDLCPVADGGEGTMEALLTTLGGETAAATVHDPLGREIEDPPYKLRVATGRFCSRIRYSSRSRGFECRLR
jgi:glycerate kinase